MKKTHSGTIIIYIGASIASLLIFLALRATNDPSKYLWCSEHGWAEGVGNCFVLAIEHFAIDALSVLSIGASLAFAVLAIVTCVKKPKKQ